MPEFKIACTSLEYTAYNVCVEAATPEEALRKFIDGPWEFDAEDDGFANAPDGMPESGEILDTAEVVGVWEHDADPLRASLRQFETPVRLPDDDTDMQQRRYLASDGHECPYCGNAGLEYESMNVDCARIEQKVTCSGCKKSWFDTYRLTGFALPQ